MLEHVVNDAAGRSARRHAHFEPFGADSFELAGGGILEVEAILDRAKRRHAAEDLERHLDDLLGFGLEDRLQHDLARRFLSAGERATEHHCVAAAEQGLGNAAVALDAAVGYQRNAVAYGSAASHERLHLRHPEVGRESRGTAAARTNAHLD